MLLFSRLISFYLLVVATPESTQNLRCDWVNIMPVFSFYGDSSARHQIKVMFNHVANFIDIFLSALGISDQASSQGMGCGGVFLLCAVPDEPVAVVYTYHPD